MICFLPLHSDVQVVVEQLNEIPGKIIVVINIVVFVYSITQNVRLPHNNV